MATTASVPARKKRIAVVIRRAAHVGSVVASAAAMVANVNPRAKNANRRPPAPSPIPVPRDWAFFLSSSTASSSSSLARLLACSATCFAAGPTPLFASVVSRVGMAPPVNHLRQRDPGCKRHRGDQKRVRAAAALPPALRSPPLRRPRCGDLRARGPRLLRSAVDRSLALSACLDQARLQLAQEGCVLGELVGQVRDEATLRGRLPRQLLEARGALFHHEVALAHRFSGGVSPVARRQPTEAACRAASANPAARPVYRVDQSTLRSIVGCLPRLPGSETWKVILAACNGFGNF